MCPYMGQMDKTVYGLFLGLMINDVISVWLYTEPSYKRLFDQYKPIKIVDQALSHFP